MYVCVTLLQNAGIIKKKRKRSFAPSDFCSARIGEALKTQDCVF